MAFTYVIHIKKKERGGEKKKNLIVSKKNHYKFLCGLQRVTESLLELLI